MRKDQKRRGTISKLCWKCDTPELVKDVLLSDTTEALLIKMNWRVRHSMRFRIKKRAEQFGVEIPAGFAGWDVLPRSMKKDQLAAVLSNRASVASA